MEKEQAIAVARARAQIMSRTPVSFMSADIGPLGDFEPGTRAAEVDADPNRLVWKVTFHGTFRPVGGVINPRSSAPHRPPPPVSTARVIVDDETHECIRAGFPAEPAPGLLAF